MYSHEIVRCDPTGGRYKSSSSDHLKDLLDHLIEDGN